MSETKTKRELLKQKETLKGEIERLQKIIDASSETTFDIIIDDLKQQMIQNVEGEHWSNVKSCIKEVDSVNGTRNFIQKQSELLSRKQEELKELSKKIDNYQPSLFEQPENENGPAIDTGFYLPDGEPIETGDIYISENSDSGELSYYVVIIAKDVGKYAVIGNTIDGELLLNYPKNRELLENAEYIGNIYYGTQQKDALDALKDLQTLTNNDEGFNLTGGVENNKS